MNDFTALGVPERLEGGRCQSRTNGLRTFPGHPSINTNASFKWKSVPIHTHHHHHRNLYATSTHHFLQQRLRDHKVIESPSFVLGSRIEAVRVVGKCLLLGVQVAERVDKSTVENRTKAVTLCIREPWTFVSLVKYNNDISFSRCVHRIHRETLMTPSQNVRCFSGRECQFLDARRSDLHTRRQVCFSQDLAAYEAVLGPTALCGSPIDRASAQRLEPEHRERERKKERKKVGRSGAGRKLQ